MRDKSKQKYDGSEMDVIDSPPLKMIVLFIFFTAVGLGYTFLWKLFLTL